MTFWIAVALLALAVVASLAVAVRRAGGRGTISIIVALLVPGIALGVYATTGTPEMPDEPHATRADVIQHDEMDGLLNELQSKLEADPTRLDGWLLLARARMKTGDAQAAAVAFARARALAPDNGDIASELGEALIQAGDGAVSDEARAALTFANQKDPRDPKALFYLGNDQLSQGHPAEAIQYWVNLVAVSPPDAPWLDDLHARIVTAANDGNVDLAQIKPTLAPAAHPAMPDRAQIQAMVNGLAARLDKNPDDVEGWRMLARSWRVLGETAKADEADARVKALETK